VVGIAAARLRRDLEGRLDADPAFAELLERVVRRETDPATAAGELLERAGDR
jgi:GTPase